VNKSNGGEETVEPFFGIVKEGLGYQKVSMRGEEKAHIEQDLFGLRNEREEASQARQGRSRSSLAPPQG
jgi:hypothetical protein